MLGTSALWDKKLIRVLLLKKKKKLLEFMFSSTKREKINVGNNKTEGEIVQY